MYKNTKAKRNFWDEHDKLIASIDARCYVKRYVPFKCQKTSTKPRMTCYTKV